MIGPAAGGCVLTCGSAVAVNSAAPERSAALGWYGGEELHCHCEHCRVNNRRATGCDLLQGNDQLPGVLPILDEEPHLSLLSRANRCTVGYGLSYSSFAYSGSECQAHCRRGRDQATVKNTSSAKADEVVQLYLGGGDGVDAPVAACAGFSGFNCGRGRAESKLHGLAEDLPKATVDVSVGGGSQWERRSHVKGSL